MNTRQYLLTYFPDSPATDFLYWCAGATTRLILPAASEQEVTSLFKARAGEDVLKLGLMPR